MDPITSLWQRAFDSPVQWQTLALALLPALLAAWLAARLVRRAATRALHAIVRDTVAPSSPLVRGPLRLLGAATFLKWVTAIAVVFMTFALVGLAAGMGAMYPRFNAENLTQVAGSYGGISYMSVAVLFIIVEIALVAWPSTVYLWFDFRGLRIPPAYRLGMVVSFGAAVAVSLLVWRKAMQKGVEALEALG